MADDYKWNIPSNKVDLDFVAVSDCPLPIEDYMFAIKGAMNVKVHNGMLTFSLSRKQSRKLLDELDLRMDKYLL